jgi:hypothetical protein
MTTEASVLDRDFICIFLVNFQVYDSLESLQIATLHRRHVKFLAMMLGIDIINNKNYLQVKKVPNPTTERKKQRF